MYTHTLVHLYICYFVHLNTCIPVLLYIPVHPYTCTFVDIYTCTPIHLYTYTYVHQNTCSPVQLYTHTFVHLHSHTFVNCTPILMCIHTLHLNTYTYVRHAFVHLYTHTFIDLCTCTLIQLYIFVHLYTCTLVHLDTYPPRRASMSQYFDNLIWDTFLSFIRFNVDKHKI